MNPACFNLISCYPELYPDINSVTDPGLAIFVGQTVNINSDTSRTYTIEANGNCSSNEIGVVSVKLNECILQCGCPEGTVEDPETGECTGFISEAPTNNGTTWNAVQGNKIPQYGPQGAYFYELIDNLVWPLSAYIDPPDPTVRVYDANGLGNEVVVDQIVQNSLWGDNNGLNDGRLNAIGVWSTVGSSSTDALPVDEWIGFAVCVEVPTTGVYSIGMAADNQIRFRVNGQSIAEFDLISFTDHFSKWHVFPITLQAGTNFIELEGLNTGQYAAFGAEIYAADTATLAAMTTELQLEAVTIFSTGNQLDQPFNLGENSGFSCPDGYALNLCGALPTCSLITKFTPIDCACYEITNCADPEEVIPVILNGPLLDLSLTYIFDFDDTKCWTITEGNLCGETTPIVTVLTSFTDCFECLPTPCYNLISCNTVCTDIPNITHPDLANFVGQLVELSEQPGCGFTVELSDCPQPSVLDLGTISALTECPGPGTIDDPASCNIVPRLGEPGFSPKNCNPDEVIKYNMLYADSVYALFKRMRYGIETCCEFDFDKAEIKFELLSLGYLFDPELCVDVVPVVVDPCAPIPEPVVCPPDISIPCTEATDVSTLWRIPAPPYVPCEDPSNVTTNLSFGPCEKHTYTVPSLLNGSVSGILCTGESFTTPILAAESKSDVSITVCIIPGTIFLSENVSLTASESCGDGSNCLSAEFYVDAGQEGGITATLCGGGILDEYIDNTAGGAPVVIGPFCIDVDLAINIVGDLQNGPVTSC